MKKDFVKLFKKLINQNKRGNFEEIAILISYEENQELQNPFVEKQIDRNLLTEKLEQLLEQYQQGKIKNIAISTICCNHPNFISDGISGRDMVRRYYGIKVL